MSDSDIRSLWNRSADVRSSDGVRMAFDAGMQPLRRGCGAAPRSLREHTVGGRLMTALGYPFRAERTLGISPLNTRCETITG